MELVILEKSKHADSLSNSFDLKTKKQEWLYHKVLNDVDSRFLFTKDELWRRLTFFAETDSITLKWNTKWRENWTPFFLEIGFNNPESLNRFVNTNDIQDEDIEMKNRSKELRTEIASLNYEKVKIENNILSYSEQINFGINTLIILGLLFFALRYILYAVQWSLKTLKK